MDKKFEIKYKYDKNYNPVYVNGAYGGVLGNGEIVANFYLERHCLPKSETYTLIEGEDSPKLSFEPENLEGSVLRFFQTGIVMNVSTAKLIVSWLNDKIKQSEEITIEVQKAQDEV
jgi:hypothetical protein